MHNYDNKINSFHDSQFYALVNHLPTHVEANQCTCHDVVSRALCHAPVAIATQKDAADLCLYQLQCMCITVVRFSPYVVINTYVRITNKAACVCSNHEDY